MSKKDIIIPENVEYDGQSIKLKIDDKKAWLEELKKKQKEILEDMKKKYQEEDQVASSKI